MSFKDLGLSESLLRAVASQGYTLPTPIQLESIPHLIAGRDVLGCAQTGTGKTAAFALPILQRLTSSPERPQRRGAFIRCLVLSPTRELALQIADSFHAYGRHTGLRHTVVYGGVSQGPQTHSLRAGVDILVATPGRLVDLMEQGFIDLSKIEVFVLDEADRMLDMGFLPDLKRVLRQLPAKRQTIFFSATMPDAIMGLAESILRNPVHVRIVSSKPTVESIRQSVCFVQQKQKPRLLADFLSSADVERALVFTRTKHGADRVVKELSAAGIPAAAIHGNKSQSVRQKTLANFKSNRNRVLIATDIAARGIDVDGISHVVNYDIPYEPETYVHRIGRTGRAGASGVAVSFCNSDEQKLLRAIERLIRNTLPVDKVSPAATMPAPTASDVPQRDVNRRPTGPQAGSRSGQRNRSIHRRGFNARSRQARPGHSQSGHSQSGHSQSGHSQSGQSRSGQGGGASGGSSNGTQQPRSRRRRALTRT